MSEPTQKFFTIITVGDYDRPASKEDVDSIRDAYYSVVDREGTRTLVTHDAIEVDTYVYWSTDIRVVSAGSPDYPVTDEDLTKIQEEIAEAEARDPEFPVYFTAYPITMRFISVPGVYTEGVE